LLTGLHLACGGGHRDIVKVLIDHRVDLCPKDNQVDDLHLQSKNPFLLIFFFFPTEKDSTPLHLACRNGRSEIVHMLLERIENLNLKDNQVDYPFFLFDWQFTRTHLSCLYQGANSFSRSMRRRTQRHRVDVNWSEGGSQCEGQSSNQFFFFFSALISFERIQLLCTGRVELGTLELLSCSLATEQISMRGTIK
jgi:hypothetical protein